MKNGITIISSSKKETNGQSLTEHLRTNTASQPSSELLRKDVKKGIESECQYFLNKVSKG
jgi:hypothetical protein